MQIVKILTIIIIIIIRNAKMGITICRYVHLYGYMSSPFQSIQYSVEDDTQLYLHTLFLGRRFVYQGAVSIYQKQLVCVLSTCLTTTVVTCPPSFPPFVPPLPLTPCHAWTRNHMIGYQAFCVLFSNSFFIYYYHLHLFVIMICAHPHFIQGCVCVCVCLSVCSFGFFICTCFFYCSTQIF